MQPMGGDSGICQAKCQNRVGVIAGLLFVFDFKGIFVKLGLSHREARKHGEPGSD
jgi:hypothetical protein